jgi:glycosyltransferase involved in cell wall biosynthesis
MKSVWAHTLVKNEERYLWYAVTSAINFVDKVLLWDSGSTDGTIGIIKELVKKYPGKIEFKQVTVGSPEDFTKIRQQMLDETESDWFLMVDGDEVWWEDSIKKVIEAINKKGEVVESIVVPMVYPVGDIYHRQEKEAGKYHLAGKAGHYNLRAIKRTIPGLSSSNPHGTWGWTDEAGKMIQDRDLAKIHFVNAPYLHFSLLPRAGERQEDKKVIKRSQKLRHELGISFPKYFFYPEVFFRPKPTLVPSPWAKMSSGFLIRAFFETPFRKIKRRMFSSKVGY